MSVDGGEPMVTYLSTECRNVSFEERITTSKRPRNLVARTRQREQLLRSVGVCVKVKTNLGVGESSKIKYSISLTSSAHSWWDSSRVDSRVAGVEYGINMENSGTFDEILPHGTPTGDSQQFKGVKWYDQGTKLEGSKIAWRMGD